MKTPDPAGELVRRTFSPPSEPGPRRTEEYDERLRYISLPTRRSHDHGVRNLVTGVALLIVSFLLMGVAVYMAGPAAAYTVGVALATAVALYVVARMRVLRQRNGNFLAGAIVCLLAVSCVLAQGVWLRLVQHQGLTLAAPAEEKAEPVTAATAAPAAPAPLIETYQPSRVELESGQVAEVVKPTKVNYEGKTWVLRPGDVFPVNTVAASKVTLGIGVDEITVPANAVRVKGPIASEPEPAKSKDNQAPASRAKTEVASTAPAAGPAKADDDRKITEDSQKEAMRRYPALAIDGSPENLSFRDAVQELKVNGGSRFFHEPEWPVRLAEMLAVREGWADANGKRKAPKNVILPDDEPTEQPVRQVAPEPTAPTADFGGPSATDVDVSAPAPRAKRLDDEIPMPRGAVPREISE